MKIPKGYIEGAIYYVTSRGDNNEDLFADDADYLTYLELLKKYQRQYGFKFWAFCLMPNHLHLLMELKEGITISDIMHDLNANYTKHFNGKYKRKGHLFQERYKMVVAEKKDYLLPIISYIHLNPSKLGLVGDLGEYKYSSYLYYYIGEKPQDAGLIMEEEIREIGRVLGINSYRDLLANIPKEEMEILGRELSKNVILGSGEFVHKVKALSLPAEQATKQAQEEIALPVAGNGAHPKFILAGVALIVILGAFNFYLYARATGFKETLKKELQKKDAEVSVRLARERETVFKDLDEKYRADMVSYQAMAKRLEIEKGKARKLEKELEHAGQK
jgi:REP element-mobilizing transposase RayT